MGMEETNHFWFDLMSLIQVKFNISHIDNETRKLWQDSPWEQRKNVMLSFCWLDIVLN